MRPEVKEMLLQWLDRCSGNVKMCARWMAYDLRIGGIAICRDLLIEAKEKD